MGRLVQQSAAARTHRQHPASRSRRALLRNAERAGYRGVTQTKRPPENPERFNLFMTAAYELGWVIDDLKWIEWKETLEGRRLMGNATAIAGADPQQLRKVLTTYLRADRFNEGALLNAFRSGVMTRLVHRAAELSASRTRIEQV
ncbi:DUF6508 domain-containing protein [Hansschlegelia beijingensis]